MGLVETLRRMMTSVAVEHNGRTVSYVGTEAGEEYIEKWLVEHGIESKRHELIKLEAGNDSWIKPGWYCEVDVSAEQFDTNRQLAHAYSSQITEALVQEGVIKPGQLAIIVPSGYSTQDGRAVISIEIA